MTDIDYEALAKAVMWGWRETDASFDTLEFVWDAASEDARQGAIGTVRAVVAAYQQQLADQGYIVIHESDIKAFFAGMGLPPFSFERLIGMTK